MIKTSTLLTRSLSFLLLSLSAGILTYAAPPKPVPRWSAVTYPVGKEVNLFFTPVKPVGNGGTSDTETVTIKVFRDEKITTITVQGHLDPIIPRYYLYIVNEAGKTSPIDISRPMDGKQGFDFVQRLPSEDFKTFMLIISPTEGLTEYWPRTDVVLVSIIPPELTLVPKPDYWK